MVQRARQPGPAYHQEAQVPRQLLKPYIACTSCEAIRTDDECYSTAMQQNVLLLLLLLARGVGSTGDKQEQGERDGGQRQEAGGAPPPLAWNPQIPQT